MTDETPEIDPGAEGPGDIDDASFDNFEKKKGTLGELWRDNALFKVGVVVAAAIAIFGTIILFGGRGEKTQPSLLPQGSQVSAPPGTEEASPAYVEAVKEQNEHRTEEANKTGTSAIPTPIEPPVGKLAVPENETPEEDPLQRWRKLQEERVQRETQRAQVAPPDQQAENNREQAIQALAQQMATQMQAILQTRNQVKLNYKDLTSPKWLDELKEKEKKDQQEAVAQAQADSKSDSDNTEEILFPAGQIAYAQLITEANSDAPGPVLAEVAGGVLNGARLIGDFKTSDQDYLTLNFDTVVIDGISYDATAVALDPKTTLPAMATDVDHHYLKKIALPAAAAFVEGMSGAISDSGLTSISVQGDTVASSTAAKDNKQQVASGVKEAGDAVRDIIKDITDKTKTTVRIKSGTHIGVLFTDPVIKNNNNARLKRPQDFQTTGLSAPYGSGAQQPYGYTGGTPLGLGNTGGVTTINIPGGSAINIPGGTTTK